MMKIVDVCAFYAPAGGGVKTYAERKLAIAASLGVDILIIVPGSHDGYERRSARSGIIHIASPTLPLDPRYRYFAEAAPVHAILDREQPDFVEASSPWRTAGIVGHWQGSAPRSLIMHADPMAAYAYRWFGGIAPRDAIDRSFRFFWNYLRDATAAFDTVICANRNLMQRLHAKGIANACTIPMGIDPGIFSPELRDEDLRRDLLGQCGLGPDAALLIGVGRHSAEKRWPMILEACARAGVERAIGLVLIGGGRQERQVARHGRGNPHIRFLAPLADRHALARAMASCDALVHGSEAETFGLVAAEAQASGLPLIVPNEGGASDFADPRCAETFTPGDSCSAAAAILRLLARPWDELKAAANARAARPRIMDSHFIELIEHYSAIARQESEAA